MKPSVTAVVCALLSVPLAALHAADAPGPQARPNILWITSEDTGLNLGCYGDRDAITPHLDRFAAAGVRFRNCLSVHPCCSPSRSALVTGVYPTRLGTFQHRGKVWVNAELVKCFPTLLRAAGYYTFNGGRGGSAKLDYNFEPKDQPWDKIGSKAIEWRSRPAGRPFFGQINLACTHQSQYGRRPPGGELPNARAARPAAARVHDPVKLHVPSYHPDTPAVREIWAEYHDRVTQMDEQFAALLKMLDDDGLTEDTIVFYFGDNGHGIPGGKVWLWDQGPHVPLIVRFPNKWSHLAPSPPGSVSDRLVSFIDFAPTVLSLTGVEIPGSMQGQVFLGNTPSGPRQYVFAARDFHDGADFDTSRMVRDARFHYIRNFMPHIGWDAIQYSWQQAPHMLDEWRQYAEAGKLQAGTRQAAFFRRAKPAEELYDTAADPQQMQNLAGDPAHQATLERMRGECERWMAENRDLGLLPQYELYVRSEPDSPLEMGADPARNPIRRLLDAARLANRRDPAAIPQLCALLEAEDSAVRRWGAIGLLALGERAAPAAEQLLGALKNTSPDVRLAAAEAACGLGRVDRALPVLIELLSHDSRIIRNETLLVLCRIGPAAGPALAHLDNALAPSRHADVWSYDNIPEMIALVRACADENASASLRQTRQKYLP